MIKILEHIRSNQNEDGSVVLDVCRGKMYSLNPVASRILELLSQGLDEAQIKSEISRQFSVAMDIIDKDVDEFLLKLADLKVISFGESASLSKSYQLKSR
jgi:Coenzyme PQQ synthesis protein D (PqqD)